MPTPRKILIADPDLDSVRALTRALRQRGYQVHYAPDGSRALELAVLRHPDLTLFDDGCRLLDARTFTQILRTNPRTEDIPVVLTTATFDADKVRGLRDGYLKKPFNLDEVLSRIDHIFRRSEAAKELRGDAQEIEGNLQQLSIPDLLQILGMNKRTGRLNLHRGAERGEIHVAEGRPANAKLGIVEGEKALFRLLAWREGTFAFTPGNAPSKPKIQRGMDDALLEAMRQADESVRHVEKLPPMNTLVVLAPDADLQGEQHPVTAQVVELLRQPRTVTEVIDLAPANDLDVLAALSTLMHKGVARIADSQATKGDRPPVLGAAEVHSLRTRLTRGRATSARTVVAKLFICSGAPSVTKRILAVPGVTRISADPATLKGAFGTIGKLAISDALHVDFCLLPPAEAAKPLWRPFVAGAVGALLLDTTDAAVKIGAFLGKEVRVPVVVVGQGVPPPLQNLPAGSYAVGEDLLDALRFALLRAMEPLRAESFDAMALSKAGAAPRT